MGCIRSQWLTSEDTSCTDVSIILLNMYNSIMYAEGNVGGIIDIPVIEWTFENDCIHVSHDMRNK